MNRSGKLLGSGRRGSSSDDVEEEMQSPHAEELRAKKRINGHKGS